MFWINAKKNVSEHLLNNGNELYLCLKLYKLLLIDAAQCTTICIFHSKQNRNKG